MPTMVADNISAGYGKNLIIRNISLEVDAKKITTIVGPNGAGKSTFAKTVVGLLKAQTGSIIVNGDDLTKVPAFKIPSRGLAYVPQVQNVFVSMTVQENLEIGGFVTKGSTHERMEEILATFKDLNKARHKRAGFLSGGQQNMLAIARALMVNPSVIVLDEPTAGLSPAYTNVVWEEIARIAESGTAVLVVEQNVERAIAHSDYVHVFVAGQNHVHGTRDEIGKLDLASIFLGRSEVAKS